MNILDALSRERKPLQADRVAVWELRLEVLERLNTIELILERGTFQTYWIDERTHHLPRYKGKYQEEQSQIKPVAQDIVSSKIDL